MNLLGVVPLISSADEPMEAQVLNSIGTAARVTKITRIKKNGGPTTISLHLEGVCRFSIDNVSLQPQRTAKVTQLDMFDDEASEDRYDAVEDGVAASVEFKKTVTDFIAMLRSKANIPSKVISVLTSLPLGVLCDVLIASIETSFEEKLQILNTTDVLQRIKLGQDLIKTQLAAFRMVSRLDSAGSKSSGDREKPKDLLMKRAGPQILNRQNNAPKLKQPDGDDEDDADEDESTVPRLKATLEEANLPSEARRVALHELKKIQSMEKSHNLGAEHQKAVTYVEYLLSLPWSKSSASLSKLEIQGAKASLDRDHFGKIYAFI